MSNGVKQGGVISLLRFSCYIDNMFIQLLHSGLSCHVGCSYTKASRYADAIALLAPSLQLLKQMIIISMVTNQLYLMHITNTMTII